MMKTMMGRSYRSQRGFTLLEALIAFVVLAGGLLAAFRFHSTTTATTADAKVRSEAVALAEQKLEELRSYFGREEIDDDADGVFNNDFDTDMPSSTNANFILEVNTGSDVPANVSAATFARNWSVRGTNPRQVDVRVTWVDRENVNQRVQLSTLVWETAPAAGAAKFASALVADTANVWTSGGTPDVEATPLDATGSPALDANGNPVLDANGNPVLVVYYDLTFGGGFTTTNATLASPTLARTSGSDSGSSCTVDTVAQTYTCTITQIDIGDTWEGTIAFSVTATGNGSSNPGVCELIGTSPANTAVLTFTKNSTSLAASSSHGITAIKAVKRANASNPTDC